jgi:hypothetical protein
MDEVPRLVSVRWYLDFRHFAFGTGDREVRWTGCKFPIG